MKNRFGIRLVVLLSLLFLFSISLGAVQASNQKGLSKSDDNLSEELSIATGTTMRISINPEGNEGNDFSNSPSISADGRYVAFHSLADNLVTGDTNSDSDIFVVDTHTGTLELISVASDGTQGNNWSHSASISGDGRFVAFTSSADNLVIDDTNQRYDIFLHDRQTGSTKRISVASDGTQADDSSRSPGISANGNFVVFTSDAVNLLPGEHERGERIFIHNIATSETELVSIAYDGTPAYGQFPDISDDGTRIAFLSGDDKLVPEDIYGGHIFVRDRTASETFRVSIASDGTPADSESRYPAISADGRYVAFESMAKNLIPDDTFHSRDIFLHDTLNGTTTLISKDSAGIKGNDWSTQPSISADGRYITFPSRADNLVSEDTNDVWDVFIHDRVTGVTARISVSTHSAQSAGESGSINEPSPISDNGRFVAFYSGSRNLVVCGPPVIDSHGDIYLRDLEGELSSISGTVISTSASPLSEVSITTNSQTIKTDSFGDFILNNMCPGEYSISASSWGYAFSPSSHQFTLPPDAVEQNFTGLPLTFSFLPVITKNYCKLSYSDSFGDPTSGWPIFEDNEVLYDYVDGEYRMMSKLPDQAVAASPDYLAENFTAEVQVRNTSTRYGVYGLVFNLAEDWSHFYSFEIDPDGYFGIWRYSDTRGWDLLLVNHSPHIKTGKGTNLIKVRREGSLIEFFSNGYLIASIEESSFIGKHRLGLMISSFDQGYLDVRFDNFFVAPSECQGIAKLSDSGTSNSSSTDFRMVDQDAHKPLH